MEVDINRNYVNEVLNALLKEKRETDPQNKEAVLACNNRILREVIHGSALLTLKDENSSSAVQIIESAQGNRFLSVYTDWQSIKKQPENIEAQKIGFEEIMDVILKEQCGLVINPFTDHLILSYATLEKLKELVQPKTETKTEEVEPVLKKPQKSAIELSMPQDQQKQLLDTGSVVLTLTPVMQEDDENKPEPVIQLANLKSTPTVLVDALSDYGKKVKELQKVWLKMMRKGEEVRMLLVVQTKGKEREISENIRMIVAPFLPYGMLLDIENVESSLGQRAVDNTPIYIRKKGLFG